MLVAFVGVLNAMLMSVTERFREIGTMKCLGALNSFIVKLFLIESLFQGRRRGTSSESCWAIAVVDRVAGCITDRPGDSVTWLESSRPTAPRAVRWPGRKR